MTLTIELSDVQAAALKAQAESPGSLRRTLASEIAENHLPSRSTAHLQNTNPKEWARRFHEWAESHDRTTPLLSDEAISRESIYRIAFSACFNGDTVRSPVTPAYSLGLVGSLRQAGPVGSVNPLCQLARLRVKRTKHNPGVVHVRRRWRARK